MSDLKRDRHTARQIEIAAHIDLRVPQTPAVLFPRERSPETAGPRLGRLSLASLPPKHKKKQPELKKIEIEKDGDGQRRAVLTWLWARFI
ncbi:hypothetical protein OUZ56_004146 [Daphnia magna]|uniref:Uncharacterized protein n=1 Tax=Daphnia magna TaxID=35525 RepID=A0ABQ9YNW6_9CRUS|nr:hypothetical protein OUZ56_004146 [Daphnia magna]